MQLISTPLIFPKVVPNDWDEWNNVWEKYKKISPKVLDSKNKGAPALWLGFDIYVKDGIDATEIIRYKCENINCPELFNSLFDNIDKIPMDIHVVRVLQSLSAVSPHCDYGIDSGHAIRSMLYDDNPKQTWYYETKNKTKAYLSLPENTNTWWYSDQETKHGTEHIKGYSKQLIMYRGVPKVAELNNLIDNSVSHYSEYAIYDI